MFGERYQKGEFCIALRNFFSFGPEIRVIMTLSIPNPTSGKFLGLELSPRILSIDQTVKDS